MRYEFIVRGKVSDTVLESLPGFTLAQLPTGGSALCSPPGKQCGLLDIVARLGDLGVSVVEIRSLPD